MLEFFMTRVRGGVELSAHGELVGTFENEAAAADLAIRYSQDAGALYRIFYPL